jgi:hypothetical protein
LATVLTFAIATIALAASASVSAHAPAGTAATQATDAAERSGADAKDTAAMHGGPIERVHDAGECDLIDVTALRGNWTHGDYVSVVARDGKTGLIRDAARSDCGMPTVSTQGGPPEQAAERAAQGQDHAEAGGPGGGHLPDVADGHVGNH